MDAADSNPYLTNRWLLGSNSECPYYGPDDGFIKPDTPHPRYIVTGGAGFIGSHLVKRLAPHTGLGQIKVIDNFWRGRFSNLQHRDGSWSICPQQDFCAMDLMNENDVLMYVRRAFSCMSVTEFTTWQTLLQE